MASGRKRVKNHPWANDTFHFRPLWPDEAHSIVDKSTEPIEHLDGTPLWDRKWNGAPMPQILDPYEEIEAFIDFAWEMRRKWRAG
mgnify:CR=1 FL=1